MSGARRPILVGIDDDVPPVWELLDLLPGGRLKRTLVSGQATATLVLWGGLLPRDLSDSELKAFRRCYLEAEKAPGDKLRWRRVEDAIWKELAARIEDRAGWDLGTIEEAAGWR